ncbi:histidine phosphatase family protein [Actinosynnema sp. NPDC059797]
MPTELVLVRHARSVVPTADGPDELTRPLQETGLAQARDLVDELLRLDPTAVASSPYLRAVQTVAPAAGALGLAVDRRWDLREWDSGLEPTPDYARHHAHSWANPDHARPGGESLDALTGRVLGALGAVAREHEGGVVLIGTHGTFAARALRAAGHPVDWPFLAGMPMPAVYRLRWDGRPTAASGPGLPLDRA